MLKPFITLLMATSYSEKHKMVIFSMIILFLNAFPAFGINTLSSPDCDTIITKNGDMIIGRIEKVSAAEILFSECQIEKGWKKSIPMTSVKEIRSSEFGERSKRILSRSPNQIEKPDENATTKPKLAQATKKRKTHQLSILSFAFGLGAICPLSWYGGLFLLLVPLSIVFGFMALKRIRRNKEKYKGKGLAIAGIVLGFLVVVFILGVITEVIIFGFE